MSIPSRRQWHLPRSRASRHGCEQIKVQRRPRATTHLFSPWPFPILLHSPRRRLRCGTLLLGPPWRPSTALLVPILLEVSRRRRIKRMFRQRETTTRENTRVGCATRASIGEYDGLHKLTSKAYNVTYYRPSTLKKVSSRASLSPVPPPQFTAF